MLSKRLEGKVAIVTDATRYWSSPHCCVPSICATVRISNRKKPNLHRLGFLVLVEAAGIEPASASPLQTVLHT